MRRRPTRARHVPHGRFSSLKEHDHGTTDHAVHRPMGRSAAGGRGPQGQRIRLPGAGAGLLGRPFRRRQGAGRRRLLRRPPRPAGALRPASPRHQRAPGRPGRARPDRRAAQGHPAAARLGRRRSGRRQRPRGRRAEEHGPRRAEAGRRRRQRLHRLEHLALAVFVSAGRPSR